MTMAANAVTAIFHGVKEFKAVTEEIELNVQKATLAALRVNQNKLKTAVRRNLRGAPRWTQRGANRITGARGNYQVPGTTGQTNMPRSGGPGKMTGVLYAGVGAAKPVVIANNWVGGVGIGANPNNVKKKPLEAKFPYFRPAVEAVTPTMLANYEKGWEAAVSRMGGIF
jgi:hypothetical protein